MPVRLVVVRVGNRIFCFTSISPPQVLGYHVLGYHLETACCHSLAVVTLKPFYLGQIHQTSLEVNSSRVLFYLGKNSGKVTPLISAPKVFTPVEFFGA